MESVQFLSVWPFPHSPREGAPHHGDSSLHSCIAVLMVGYVVNILHRMHRDQQNHGRRGPCWLVYMPWGAPADLSCVFRWGNCSWPETEQLPTTPWRAACVLLRGRSWGLHRLIFSRMAKWNSVPSSTGDKAGRVIDELISEKIC